MAPCHYLIRQNRYWIIHRGRASPLYLFTQDNLLLKVGCLLFSHDIRVFASPDECFISLSGNICIE